MNIDVSICIYYLVFCENYFKIECEVIIIGIWKLEDLLFID